MAKVRAEFIVPQKGGAHRYKTIGDQVSAYDIDSAMDTDTDSWTIQLGIGDQNEFVQDMLSRDTEVRVNLYAVGHNGTETLHSGFVDEITLDDQGIMNFQGRDITCVAVDSQHPPQIWHGIRPEVLVAREARALKIGDKLKLTKARGFKTYATDGSESYWQVWYRFYRKRRMWMWAEADGTLNAMTLNYNQPVTYYFGEPATVKGRGKPGFIPVENVQWRANKSQRVGEVYYFGHRGDIGFVGSADDPQTRPWIKRPTVIIASGDAHNAAEARVEAWEEIFESKVGATEITLTVADPGHTIRQDRMAYVNLPTIGLKGQFYVVGVRQVGSVADGFYQVVRLREKNYAISRRVPTDPTLKGAGTSVTTSGAGDIASNIAISASADVKQFFVNAANKYKGPWDFKLFLGVLLAIGQQESNFGNKREGGQIIYPGTENGAVPTRSVAGSEGRDTFAKFQSNFANEISKGHSGKEYGVGIMQLTTLGYKLAADRLSGGPIDDELYGGRWDPESNIMAGAAALASKLGAGWSVGSDGKISAAPISGFSLQPTEANMWGGVMAYNGSGPDARRYMATVKSSYENNYKSVVDTAVQAAKKADVNAQSTFSPGQSSAELRSRVLNNSMITFTRQSQRDDIKSGQIHDAVLIFLSWFTDAGWPVTITALKSDHDKLTTEGRLSAHGYGLAVDMGNYSYLNPKTSQAMKFIATYQSQLAFAQMIGPDESLVIPLGIYDRKTLDEHKSHIHMGWATGTR